MNFFRKIISSTVLPTTNAAAFVRIEVLECGHEVKLNNSHPTGPRRRCPFCKRNMGQKVSFTKVPDIPVNSQFAHQLKKGTHVLVNGSPATVISNEPVKGCRFLLSFSCQIREEFSILCNETDRLTVVSV